MQSSRSLLALGLGTAVAVGSVGAAPGQAAPLSHSYADAPVVSPTSEKRTERSAKPDPAATSSKSKLEQSALEQSAKPNSSLEPFVVSVQPVPTQGTDSQKPTLEVNSTFAQPLVQFSSAKAGSNADRTQPAVKEAIASAPEPQQKPQVQPAAAPTADQTQAVPEPTPSADAPASPQPAQTNSSQPDQSQSHRSRANHRRGDRQPQSQGVSQGAAPESTAATTPAAATPAAATPDSTAPAAATPASTAPAPSSEAKPSGKPSGTTPSANPPSANPPSMDFNPGAPSATPPSTPFIPTKTETSNEPAPDYLNPDPNPLSFPTQPDEVKIEGTQPITLKQAIELAVRNTRTLQEARLNVDNSQAQLREQEAQNFPTLALSSALAFSAQQQGTATRNPQTGATTGFNGTTFPNQTTLNATVNSSYNLFTSGVRSARIQAAREQVKFQQLQLESTTEQLILDVTNNYYDLQNADEQVRIAQDSVTQAQQSLRDSQALERAGVGTRFDVLQSQVDLANSQQTLTQNISNQQVAQRQLVQQLALSQTVNVTAADPIAPAGVWTLPLEDTIVLAFKNRAELEQFLVQRDIAEQNRRQAVGSIRPQITATASSGVQRTLDNSTSVPFFDGFLANFQAQLELRWSIFDGGAARAQANQAKISGQIAENRFAEQREQIRFNVEQGYSVLQSSYSNIQVTTLAVQQAQEALRLARLRFQAGVGTQTDVLQQQTALTQAEVNRLTAILNYNRALATLNRQVSNYPGGNIGDTP